MDYKNIFGKFEDSNVFIRTTVKPSMEKAHKAALNRKGNMLFNSGEIEKARRIFMTTGYSDGLSRVGDYYKSKDQLVEALQMYWIARNHLKYEPMLMQIAGLIQNLVKEEEASFDV